MLSNIVLYPWSANGQASTAAQPASAYSALNLLVVTAGFFLLVTGTYPRPLFDFLVGLNRWLYRVITYVAFMSDEYPPFRLDVGAREAEPLPA